MHLQLHRRDPYTAGRTWVTGRCPLGCRCTSTRCYFRSSHKHLDRLPLQRPRWIGTQLLKDSTADAEELLVVIPHRVEQGETYGKPKFASYLRRDELAQWAVQLVDTDGSKENWDRDMMSKQLR